MEIDRARAREAFGDYVAAYDPRNPRIALKIAHTYRVATLAAHITESLDMPAPDVDLAWLCGLLHDVGRFEQVRRWNTFRDADSAPHAALGIDVLFGEGHLRDYLDDASQDDLIRTAIATHSDFRLPEGLDQRTRAFCDILRDADKVDIIRTVSESEPETIVNASAQELLASTISPAATSAFDARRCMLRSERSAPVDIVVSFACFAFELVYPESRRELAEQGCLTRLLEQPFGLTEPYRDPHTRSELARMASELAAWLVDQQEDEPRTAHSTTARPHLSQA